MPKKQPTQRSLQVIYEETDDSTLMITAIEAALEFLQEANQQTVA